MSVFLPHEIETFLDPSEGTNPDFTICLELADSVNIYSDQFVNKSRFCGHWYKQLSELFKSSSPFEDG